MGALARSGLFRFREWPISASTAKGDTKSRGNLGLRHLTGQPRDLAFLLLSDSAPRAVRIPKSVTVLRAVKLVLGICLPFEMPRVDTAIVSLAAVMRGLMLRRWRRPVGQFAHKPVSPVAFSFVFQHAAVDALISTKRPD